MSRLTWVSFAVGLLGLGGVAALGFLGAAAIMPSYLAAWLVLLALPLGALPVVMVLELLGKADARIVPVLRQLVATMPLAALLSVPVLLRLRGLYPLLATGAPNPGGLSGWWMVPAFVLGRAILLLGVWTFLAFAFAKPPSSTGRSSLAIGGLVLHVVMGTLAAIDWTQALEPSFTSSASGLVLIAAQIGLAASLAVALLARSPGPPSGRQSIMHSDGLALGLVVALASWGFLVFTQYLVVWSANLPREVAWYQHRSAGVGQGIEYAAGLVCALAFAILLPRGKARRSHLLASVAAALVLLHGIEMFWLVTPAFRFEFRVTFADVLALLGMGSLGLGAALLAGGLLAPPERTQHGAA